MNKEELEALTDEELVSLISQAYEENQKRVAMASIPAEVARLAREYREGGGEQSNLDAAIDPDNTSTTQEATANDSM